MERSNIKSVAKNQGIQEQLLIANYTLLIENPPPAPRRTTPHCGEC